MSASPELFLGNANVTTIPAKSFLPTSKVSFLWVCDLGHEVHTSTAFMKPPPARLCACLFAQSNSLFRAAFPSSCNFSKGLVCGPRPHTPRMLPRFFHRKSDGPMPVQCAPAHLFARFLWGCVRDDFPCTYRVRLQRNRLSRRSDWGFLRERFFPDCVSGSTTSDAGLLYASAALCTLFVAMWSRRFSVYV